jgi:hypothetical protein
MTVSYDDEHRELVVRAKSVERRWPVSRWDHNDESIRTRGAVVTFENRWALSIIWGGCTYSSNHDYLPADPGWRHVETQPFIEQPALVEVGVLTPEPHSRGPMMTDEALDVLRDSEWTTPETRTMLSDPGQREFMLKDQVGELWGDPLSYLDADELLDLADVVVRLPSHPQLEVPERPEFHDLDSFLGTVAQRFGLDVI